MSKLEELEEKLKDLQHREFMVQMVDHWTQEDYKLDNELHQEIMKTKKQINDKHSDVIANYLIDMYGKKVLERDDFIELVQHHIKYDKMYDVYGKRVSFEDYNMDIDHIKNYIKECEL